MEMSGEPESSRRGVQALTEGTKVANQKSLLGDVLDKLGVEMWVGGRRAASLTRPTDVRSGLRIVELLVVGVPYMYPSVFAVPSLSEEDARETSGRLTA